MAWVFDDPWDDYMDLTQRWDVVNGLDPNFAPDSYPSIAQGMGRRGTAALKIPTGLQSSIALIQKNVPYQSTYMAQFAINVWTGQSATIDSPVIVFLDGTNIQAGLSIRADGHLVLVSGSSTRSVSNAALGYGESHYIEIKAPFSSAANVIVRVDGIEFINGTFNTDASGNGYAGAVRFGHNYNPPNPGVVTLGYFIDDFILLDTTTGDNPDLNDLIGDHALGVLLTDGSGDSTQWTVVGADANWKAVRDMPFVHNAGEFDTWTVTADGTNGVNYPANVVDGDRATRWRVTGSLPHEIIFDMGAAYDVDIIQFLPYPTIFWQENPGTIDLYVSDDGSTWGSAVENITGLAANGDLVTWVLSTIYTHRYFKLVVTATTSGGTSVSISKVSVSTVYVKDSTTNDTDLNNYQDLDITSGTIAFASVWPYGHKENGGDMAIRIKCKSNTTTVDNGSDLALSTEDAYIPIVYEVDPDTTNPWTVSGFNAAQFGPKEQT